MAIHTTEVAVATMLAQFAAAPVFASDGTIAELSQAWVVVAHELVPYVRQYLLQPLLIA